MARKRMIDPHIWEDPSFNDLSIGARLLFIGMISNADDEGYIRGDAGSLKRLIYGFDDIGREEIDKWIGELNKLKNIHFYLIKNETYAHFTTWDNYQKQQVDRIIKTTYPKCPQCDISTTVVLNQVEDDEEVKGNLPIRIRVAQRDRMCRYCGIPFPSGGVKFILEHVIPVALGGQTTDENCVLACQSCNTKKGSRTPNDAGMELIPLKSDIERKQFVNTLDTKVKISKVKLSKDIIAEKPQSSPKTEKKEIKPHIRVSLDKASELQRLVYFLEDTLKTSIVNWGKQAKALSMMKKAGYNEEQIKFAIKHMAKDEYWEDKGFDLMNVANNIANLKSKLRRGT